MPNQHDEMVPPWEEFPTYERYTIGWRMGVGEDYRYKWYAFIEELPNDYDSRLDYLKRHRPAPLNWGDEFLAVLYPDTESDQQYGCSQAETLKLLELGLVAYDAAYRTWLAKQTNIVWPWLLPGSETPESATRYRTREFWFFSRQLDAVRGDAEVEPDKLPRAWKAVEPQLLTGRLGEVDPTMGLLTLAQMLCAGAVQPPWTLGLSPNDFQDSFEMNMGYVDAFRLWMMCAFDDDKLLREMLKRTGIPSDWMEWVDQQAKLG